MFQGIPVSDSCIKGIKRTTCHWRCADDNFPMSIQFQTLTGEASFSSNTTCVYDATSAVYCSGNTTCDVTCDNFEDRHCLYASATFWGFIFLMALGNIGFNVSNSISDAICFDILGIAEFISSRTYSGGRKKVYNF